MFLCGICYYLSCHKEGRRWGKPGCSLVSQVYCTLLYRPMWLWNWSLDLFYPTVTAGFFNRMMGPNILLSWQSSGCSMSMLFGWQILRSWYLVIFIPVHFPMPPFTHASDWNTTTVYNQPDLYLSWFSIFGEGGGCMASDSDQSESGQLLFIVLWSPHIRESSISDWYFLWLSLGGSMNSFC